MVEESAGTKMYETKRCFAQKTIEKKEAKVNEMTTVSKNLMEQNKYLVWPILSYTKIYNKDELNI